MQDKQGLKKDEGEVTKAKKRSMVVVEKIAVIHALIKQ